MSTKWYGINEPGRTYLSCFLGNILMFIFSLLLIPTCLAVLLIRVIKCTITIGCNNLNQKYIGIVWHIVDILDLQLHWCWVCGSHMEISFSVVVFHG